MLKITLATFLSTAMLVGCHVVHVDGPVGTALEPEAVHRFVGQWEFVMDGDRPVGSRKHVRMLKDGNLRVAEMKWSQEDQKFFVMDAVAVITSIGQHKFLNLAVPGSEEAGPPNYLVARLRWQGDAKVNLFPANFDEFKRRLDSNDLPGELTSVDRNKTIILAAENLLARLEKHPDEIGNLFPEVDGKPPIVMSRFHKADDVQKRFSRDMLDQN